MKRVRLSSASNPLLKQIRLAVSKGRLTSEGWIVAESFHLLKEAFRSSVAVEAVISAHTALETVESMAGGTDVTVHVVSDELFDGISGTEANQGVMALVRAPEWREADLFRGTPLVLLLDGIQDPGNCGAILRAAEAFSASGVILLPGTVSAFNPKAVRASAGSVFRMPVVSGLSYDQVLSLLRVRDIELLAAVPSGRPSISQVDLTGPSAIVVGSEGKGVSQALLSAATALTIPTHAVESLNAAVAASILLYEAYRQRSA